MNEISVIFRLTLAMICGGAIGYDRGQKRRPAGFRTYMLVCIGATLVMLVNEYIHVNYGGDPARFGAQVISGIGFLGAGTIIVTGKRQVKGLTTAAGLWVSACMGLAIGVGFYLGAIIACVLVLFIMTYMQKIEDRLNSTSRLINLYLEFEEQIDINSFISTLKGRGIKITEMDINRIKTPTGKIISILITLLLPATKEHDEIIALIGSLGAKAVEEI